MDLLCCAYCPLLPPMHCLQHAASKKKDKLLTMDPKEITYEMVRMFVCLLCSTPALTVLLPQLVKLHEQGPQITATQFQVGVQNPFCCLPFCCAGQQEAEGDHAQQRAQGH